MKLTIDRNTDPLLVTTGGLEYQGCWHPIRNIAIWAQWPTPSGTVQGTVVFNTVEAGEVILEFGATWAVYGEDLCFAIKELEVL